MGPKRKQASLADSASDREASVIPPKVSVIQNEVLRAQTPYLQKREKEERPTVSNSSPYRSVADPDQKKLKAESVRQQKANQEVRETIYTPLNDILNPIGSGRRSAMRPPRSRKSQSPEALSSQQTFPKAATTSPPG